MIRSICVRLFVFAALLSVTLSEQINQEIDVEPTESIYQTNQSVNQTRHVKHAVLAYLTPWNGNGFETALQHLDRFTHLSPVWHQMKVTQVKQSNDQSTNHTKKGATLTVDGLNDKHWIAKFHSAESSTKLVPRVVLEMTREQQLKLAKSKKMQEVFIKRIVSLCKNEQYDGIVLEATDFHALARQESMEALVSSLRFTVDLGQQLHRMNPARELIFVVRPWFVNSPYFQHEDAVPVGEAVDYYSLMTYDYSSNSDKPGPNAPFLWAREVVQKFIGTHSTEQSRAKVLLGLNFYGMIWGEATKPHRPIVGHEYETLIENANHVEKTWNNNSMETLTVIDDTLSIYYPDAQSVSVRVGAANEWGVGLSIWELGQGTNELVDQL